MTSSSLLCCILAGRNFVHLQVEELLGLGCLKLGQSKSVRYLMLRGMLRKTLEVLILIHDDI